MQTRITKAVVFSLALVFAFVCVAQERPHINVETIAPRSEDVGSINGIIKAFYDVISGPAGQPRQWSRDRTLYIPDVRFVAIQKKSDGSVAARAITHQQFVDGADAYMVKNGFFESEIHRDTQQYGNIAHVFSTYESRNKVDGPVIERGINSISLFNDGKRWWILSAEWDDESTGTPIPKQFLPAK